MTSPSPKKSPGVAIKKIRKIIEKHASDHDEKYYSKHNNYAIPRTIIRRLITKTIFEITHKALRLEKKAIDILHSEIEKYVTEIFSVSECMMEVSKRNTVCPLFFKKAAQLHDSLLRN